LRDRPAIDDRFIVTLSTKQLGVVLITPQGQHVTKENSEASGYSWSDLDFQAAIGSTDGGQSVAITFAKPGAAGSYVLEVTGRGLATSAWAQGSFASTKREYAEVMRALNGVNGLKTAGPVALRKQKPSVELAFNLTAEDRAAFFDIVITNDASTVWIVLPDGRRMDETIAMDAGVEWTKVKQTTNGDSTPFLVQRAGTHHLISLENAPPGKYQIHATTAAGEPASVSAACLPLGRLSDDLAREPTVGPGAVRLQAYGLPYDCYVGDKLDLAVGVLGDARASSLNFEVRLEYREIVRRSGPGPIEYTEPLVEPTPVTFTRSEDAVYRGRVAPARPGILRVGIRVIGRTTTGRSFSEETIIGSVNVHGVVARFRSLSEKAVDKDGNGILDHPEIAAELDVVLPGKYDLRLSLNGPESQGLLASGEQMLGVGPQTLIVSIPAERLRVYLKDGPWKIGGVQIFRPEGNSFGSFVATAAGLTLTTAAYKRAHGTRAPHGATMLPRRAASIPVQTESSGW
jgi:hypothetical protein